MLLAFYQLWILKVKACHHYLQLFNVLAIYFMCTFSSINENPIVLSVNFKDENFADDNFKTAKFTYIL